MSPLVNTHVEPWQVRIAGIGCVDISADGTTVVHESADESATRILAEHVAAPLASWRRGSWLVNGALMRTPAGAVILVNSTLESWYPALVEMLNRGWTCLADRLVEVTVHDSHVRAESQSTGATIPRWLVETWQLEMAHPARPGSDVVELHPPVLGGDHSVSALAVLESRFELEPELGFARAQSIRNLLAMPELRSSTQLAEILTALGALPFQRFPSTFQPKLGDERDIGRRSQDTVKLLETWVSEVLR